MCNGKCGGGCIVHKICKILIYIGGLNWGLIGLGMLMGSDLNVVHLIFQSMPTLEGVVYLLVGIATVMKIFGCKCKKCMVACATCEVSGAEKKM